MDLLELRNVRKRFGGLMAVDKLSLKVSAGEVHGLIGPNGAGKSTVINIITGVYKPDGGQIIYNGDVINKLRPFEIANLGITRTFQTIRLWEKMSLVENIMVGFESTQKFNLTGVLMNTKSARQGENAAREVARECLYFVGLEQFENRAAGSLAYGQRRLLEIARALATQPKIILLDEPAAGMNQSESAFLVAIIKKIRAKGIAVILIEHNIALVSEAADWISVLSFGEKIAEGAPQDVVNNPEVVRVYLGEEIDNVEN